MSQFRWLASGTVLIAAVALFVGFEAVRGQTGKKSAEKTPEQFFSADTVVYFRFDGTKAHQADWEKTAAYKALVKSGLTKAIDQWLTKVSEREPQAALGQKLLWHVMEQGFSLGVISPDDVHVGDAHLTLVLHGGASFVEDLNDLIPVEKNVVTDVGDKNNKADDRTYSSVAIPDQPGCTLCWWSENGHLVLTLGIDPSGSASAERILQVIRGKNPNITSQPDWKRRNTLDDGQVLTGVAWIDMKRIVEKYRDIEVPEGPGGKPIRVGDMLEIFGVDNLTEIIGKQGYDGDVCVGQVEILHDGSRRGLLTLLDGQSMTLDDLPPLPEYSTTIMTGSIDAAAIYDSVISFTTDLMAKLDAPDQDRDGFQQALQQADEIVGGSLRDDVLANLGPVHTFFSDPTNGIAGFGFGYAVRVKNTDTFKAAVDRLLKLIPESRTDQEPRVMRNNANGRDYISFGQPGIPFFPTLSIHDGWLVGGLSTQTIDAFYDRKSGEIEKWSPTQEHQALLAKLPTEFASLSIYDPREAIRAVNQYLPMLQGAMASSPETQGFPLPVLPSADRIVKPMFPSATVTTIDESGIHYHTRQALPGLPLLGTMDNMSVGTIAVGVALLLPAVQQAREAARRTQSKNNIKQIMLALHNYHDVHNRLPAGVLPGQEKPEDGLSWCVAILPYIDQQAVAERLDQKKAWNDDANKFAGQLQMPVFRNPSAQEVDLKGYAQFDYAGVAGLGKDGPNKKVSDKGAGVFAYNRSTHFRDIHDGTSNTLMVGDVSKNVGPWLQGGKATIRPFVENPYIGGADGWGGVHVGGANFGLADGSVRFISQNIDPKVLEALVTIQGGEPIGDF